MNPSQNPYRGLLFARTIKALGVARGSIAGAIAYANSQGWPNAREVAESIKAAAVAPMGTESATVPTPAAFDFAEFVRPLTVLGKLIGLRRVPFRVRSIAATSGSGAYWSGEAKPRPLSKMTFAGSTLEQLSVIAMLVVTRELLNSSAPSAESILSRDLAAAAVEAMDRAFLDASNLGIPGIKPAAITSAAAVIHSSGSTLAALDNDLALLIEALSDSGSDLTYATFVTRPRTALYLSLLRGTGGNLAYPQMSVKGGTLAGLPCIVSAASPSGVGSPAEFGNVAILDPSQILVADDGGAALEVSEEASLQMTDAPVDGATTEVSMFQTLSAVLKAVRFVNWQRCRAGMAWTLDTVAY